MVTTVTTASASGSASGNHAYTSSGFSSSWAQTGNYAAGNGTSSGTSASSGLSVAESMQSQWQEGYTITAGPAGTTTTGGASGSGEASGNASWHSSGSGFAESDTSGSGHSYASGTSWSSGVSGQDNYNDQTSWSEPWNLVGASSSGSSSSGTTLDHVWGSATSGWSSGSWWSSQGSGSGSGSGSSGSLSTSGSGSGGYDQYVNYPSFYQGAGFHGTGASGDLGWAWGVGWTGAGTNGPLGPSAYCNLGFAFAPGNPVSVTNPGSQSGTEGDQINLQVQATDWAAGSGSASGSGGSSGGGWSALGLPNGLNISTVAGTTNGLITGTIQPGDAANGPYFVTASYTDGAGNSASQTFEWDVSDPVTMIAPGDQSGAEGDAVSLQIQSGDSTGGTLAFGATGLPAGLSISAATGLITGTIAAGAAATGSYAVTVTATDGTYSVSQTFSWAVTTDTPAAASNPLDAVFASIAATASNGMAAFMLLDQPQEQPAKAKSPFDLIAPADAPLKQEFMDEAYYAEYLQYKKTSEGFTPNQELSDQQKAMKISVEAVQELLKLRDMKSDYLQVNVYYVNLGVTNFTVKASRDPGSINLFMGHGEGPTTDKADPDSVASVKIGFRGLPLKESDKTKELGQPLYAFVCCYGGTYNGLIPDKNAFPDGKMTDTTAVAVYKGFNKLGPQLKAIEAEVEKRVANKQKVVLNLYFGVFEETHSGKVPPADGSYRFSNWK